jgi:GTP-binding protein
VIELDPLRIVEARFIFGAASVEQLPPPTGVEIAFAGRSNVGKSSLMNALCQRKNLVRTSSTPGCTRQISFFEVKTKDGAQLTLVDLPGYGYARRSKGERSQWADLIEYYLLSRPTLKVVVALVDVRRGAEEDDEDLIRLLRSKPRIHRPELNVITVTTKLDKVPSTNRKLEAQRATALLKTEGMAVSTEMPETVERLWRRLRIMASIGLPTETVKRAESEAMADSDEPALSSESEPNKEAG